MRLRLAACCVTKHGDVYATHRFAGMDRCIRCGTAIDYDTARNRKNRRARKQRAQEKAT